MSNRMIPKLCPACQAPLCIERLICHTCTTVVQGEFPLPRLARFTEEEQRFLELFLLCSGSLKSMSNDLGVSYPTVRKRLNALVYKLENEIEKDALSRPPKSE
jgi:hypothetical protein